MKRCPVCKSIHTRVITQRKNMSPYQNKLFITKTEACNFKKVNICICICEKCGFVFNQEFDETISLYDDNYNNDQNASKVFDFYINESIEYLVKKYIGNKAKILEIGCGKYATYLKKIMERLDSKSTGIGYDPSYEEKSNVVDVRMKIFKEFYQFEENNMEKLDLVICRHVIEHISNPMSLLNNISALAKNSLDLKIFIETPDVSWILKNKVWFDFFYEHCSYFSPVSFKAALNLMGLTTHEVRKVFGGQYIQVIIEKRIEKLEDELHIDEKELEEIMISSEEYSKDENIRLEKIATHLAELKKNGEIALWGAGAKANTFLNILDNSAQYISNVIDINSNKYNKFIAGTGHKIISPKEVKAMGIRNILVMNGNYYEEIKKILEIEKVEGINLINIEQL